ncbi:MAG: OmpA family protein [Bacteroidales bacterium]|nr:OmpA family protein [Bacteroidales bacterium]
MNSKSFLIIAVLMLMFQTAVAQRFRQAFVDLDEGYFLDANDQFSSAIRKKKDLPIANYGMGLLLMDAKYPKHNIKQAYSYLGKAQKHYSKLPEKKVQYYTDSYGISIDTINARIDELVKPEFLRIEKLNSATLYRAFARQYRSSVLYRGLAIHRADSMEAIKNRLASDAEQRCWNFMVDPNTDLKTVVDMVSRYTKKYMDTPFMGKRKHQYDSLLADIRNRIVATDNHGAARNFNKLFPNQATPATLWAEVIKDPRYGIIAMGSVKRADAKTYKIVTKKEMDSIVAECEKYAVLVGEGKDFECMYSPESKRMQKILDSVYHRVPFGKKYNISQLPIYEDFIAEAAPHELAYQAVLKIMSPYIKAKDYAGAAEVLRHYRPLFPHMDARIEKTIDLLTLSAPSFKDFRKLPESVNSNHVHSPVLTADFKTLYFAISTRPDNINYIDYDEQIMMCDYDGGQCNNVRKFPRIQNPYWYEDPADISPDGNNFLYYYRNLMYTIPVFDTTAKGRPMDQINFCYQCRNCSSWTPDASYTSDGNAILFASNYSCQNEKVGGYHQSNYETFHGDDAGTADIFVCLKDEDGNWGEPINLGATINTPFSERCPVLASDMKTLYFASTGHYGLGGSDLFMSRRLRDDSWTEWSEPVNLGRNINTENYESSFKIASDGKLAFFSSNGNIYSFILPDSLQAEEVSVVSGKVLDSKGNALKASISWEDLDNGRLIGTLNNNPETGEFYITLPTGKNYGYTIESDGYFPTSGSLDTKGSSRAVTVNSDVRMYSLDEVVEGGISIVLNNVFFETGKYDLRPESYNELIRLVYFFDQHAGLRLEISGHTDNVGNRDTNLKLSENRANAVRNFLLDIGLPESSIEVRGMGDSSPIADNSTPEGRALNRRVEFKILK